MNTVYILSGFSEVVHVSKYSAVICPSITERSPNHLPGDLMDIAFDIQRFRYSRTTIESLISRGFLRHFVEEGNSMI